MSANEHIDELLSGFLDGQLNAEEMRELELAMSADASLKSKLEQMQQLSSDLRCIPKRTLGPDFTKRVLAAAEREASQSGNLQVPTARAGDRHDWRKAMAGLAAMAATLFFAAYVSNWFSSSNGDLVTNVPPVETNSSNKAVVDSSLGTPSESPTKSPAETPNASRTLVRNDPRLRQRVTEFAVLPILEIEPTEKAWKENEISKVFNDAGIAWTNPLKVSDDVIQVLNETRSISHGQGKTESEPLALVMVMANGRRMEKVLEKISNDVEAFPHVLMDLAFDLPGKELCSKLVNAQLKVADGQQSVASPVVAGSIVEGTANRENIGKIGIGHFTQFSAPAKFAEPGQRQSEFGTGSVGISPDEEDASTYVLFVIRQPSKK